MKGGFQAFALEEGIEHCGIVFRNQPENLHSISIVVLPLPNAAFLYFSSSCCGEPQP